MENSSGPFVSYAQNFEDVMLWRALKHIANGFYVDIGANDPQLESVTHAFYTRGWHGINIEPMKFYYDRLCAERPHDVNLQVAVGAKEEQRIFYEIENTGLSTFIAANAQALESKDWQIDEHPVQLLPLNNILKQYCSSDIHFMKIDVECFEKEVLQGLDLHQWKPWIMVIEATRTGTEDYSYLNWEPLVLEAGYQFVYYDGLNRFYVSKEHAELNSAFNSPPNIFDGFITGSQLQAENERAEKRQALDRLQTEMNSMRILSDQNIERFQALVEDLRKELEKNRLEFQSLLHDLQRKLQEISFDYQTVVSERDEFRDRSNILSVENEKLWNQVDQIKNELVMAKTDAENYQKEYRNIFSSKSYQYTAPFRIFVKHIRQLFFNYAPLDSLADKSKANKIINVDDEKIIENQLSDQELHFYHLIKREVSYRKHITKMEKN